MCCTVNVTEPTNIVSEVLILNVLRADHIGEYDNAAGFPEAFPVFTSLRIFVEIDNLPHLRPGAKAFPVILAFALTTTTRHLLNGQGVHNPTAVGAEALTFLMAPFGHETGSKALRIRPAKIHENEVGRKDRQAPTSCTACPQP